MDQEINLDISKQLQPQCDNKSEIVLEESECVTESESENLASKRPADTPTTQLSKRQLKRLKKREQFNLTKKERRKVERERMKAKRKEALELGLPSMGPTRKELKRRNNQQRDVSKSVKIVIDLDFDEQMSERDTAKCVKQCLRIYTINRRSDCPCQIYLTGIKTDGRIHESFKKNDGWENWNIQFSFDQTHVDIFTKDEMIYLTSESDNVVEQLDNSKVYVIGGLVDYNHHKGLCHARAIKAGITTARLPLNKYIDMKSRSVLTTFHVFEILLRLSEGKSWTDALLQTLPMRKGAIPKQDKGVNIETALLKNININSNNKRSN